MAKKEKKVVQEAAIKKKKTVRKANAKDSRSEGDVTAMRNLFIFNYIENGFKNGRKAAIDAGFAESGAHVEASKLLTNANIQKRIAEKKIELEAELDAALKISKTQILAKWAKIGLKVSDASIRDQLKATEFLARHMGMFNEAGKGDDRGSRSNDDRGVRESLRRVREARDRRAGRLGKKKK